MMAMSAGFALSTGTHIAVDGTGTTIGRDASAGNLDDPLVSARHLHAQLTDDGLTVTDLGSTNGTWLAGRKVTIATLRHGDVLRIGHTLLTAVVPPKAAPTTPSEVDTIGPATSLELIDHWEKLRRASGKRGIAAVRWISKRSRVPFRDVNALRLARNRIAHRSGHLTVQEAGALRAVVDRITAALAEASRDR